MPQLRQERLPRPGPAEQGPAEAPPFKAYTWRGDLPPHPDAPIPLCDQCGFLVTARAHHFTCEWPQTAAASTANRGNPA